MAEPVKRLDWANRRRRHVQQMVTTQTVLDVLADAFALDRDAVRRLFDYRVACNEKLAEHPKIVIQLMSHNNMVGVLGLINGILGAAGQPLVAAIYSQEGALIGFKEYAEPCTTPPPGWHCSREAGHEGPCAATPTLENKS